MTDHLAEEQLLEACRMQPQSLLQIRPIVETNPGAIRTVVDVQNQLALHLACANKAPLEVVRFLVEQWPDSVKAVDSQGRLPLHEACCCRAPLAVVRLLVESWPESVQAVDEWGQTPLDLAKASDAPQEVVDYLTWLPSAALETHKIKKGNVEKNKAREETETQIEEKNEGDVFGKELRLACAAQPQDLYRIQSILKRCPDAIKSVDELMRLPLHLACANQAPLEVIQCLVQQWPESVKKGSKDDCVPLHLACKHDAELEVIQYLVGEWPESVQVADNSEFLPLHLACEFNAPLNVVQYLVEQCPESVKALTINLSTPLHCALLSDISSLSLDVIEYLVQKWLGAINAADSEGSTPLELALSRGAPDKVIDFLGFVSTMPDEISRVCRGDRISLQKLPELTGRWSGVVTAADDDGMTLLHRICKSHVVSKNVVEYLRQQWPECDIAFDHFHRLPLHYACSQDSPYEVIEYLIQLRPGTVTVADQNGHLPLHWACAHKAPYEIVEFLVKQFPGALRMAERKGLLPLHIACGKQAPLDVIDYLAQECPELVRFTNQFGLLPLHYSCAYPAAPAVVQSLVNKWPNSVRFMGGAVIRRTALHLACSHRRASLRIVKLLLREWPGSIIALDSQGATPRQVAISSNAPNRVTEWLEMASRTARDLRRLCQIQLTSSEGLQILVDQWEGSVGVADDLGMLPLHHVCGNRASLEVIMFLVQKWRDSTREVDKHQRLPLHIACKCQPSLEVIKYLTCQWPESVLAVDDEQRLPLHYACSCQARREVVEYLVEQKPESVQQVDRSGRLPIQYACVYDAVPGVVQFLVSQWPNFAAVSLPQVAEMDFGSSATLFGNLSPFVSARRSPLANSADKLAKLLIFGPPDLTFGDVNDEGKHHTVRSNRQKILFERIGGGVLETIWDTALSMNEDQFDELIQIAGIPEIHVGSRVALESIFEKISSRRQNELNKGNESHAQVLKEALDELELLRAEFPSLEELERKRRELLSNPDGSKETREEKLATLDEQISKEISDERQEKEKAEELEIRAMYQKLRLSLEQAG